MRITPILKTAQKFAADNSPAILTGLAVAGTVTTAVLAGKAGYAAAMTEVSEPRLEVNPDDETDIKIVPISTVEKVKLVWKEFIPAAIVGTATVTCIIAANRIGTKRAAAIAAAFKLSEELAEEYKRKVVDTLGAQKEEKMRAELAKDQMLRTPGAETVIIVGSEVLIHDALSGRFFKNEWSKIEKAVNEINYQINNFYHASLTEFYEKIGLSGTVFSDEVGWNSDELLDIKPTAVMLEDGRPAISIQFRTVPIRGYDRCH